MSAPVGRTPLPTTGLLLPIPTKNYDDQGTAQNSPVRLAVQRGTLGGHGLAGPEWSWRHMVEA